MSDAVDTYAYWRNALEGRFGPVHEGHPQAGFFRKRRSKDDRSWVSVAIWAVGNEWHAVVDGKHASAEAVWTHCCTRPITEELYRRIAAGEPWPDDVKKMVVAETTKVEPEEPGIGHNSGDTRPLHEQMGEEITITGRAFAKWLDAIGGAIVTEEHDAAGEAWKAQFQALERKAELAHKAEKEPHLLAGRAVDEAWRKPKEWAGIGKGRVADALTPYRLERQRIRDEEWKRQQDAAAAVAAAQRAAMLADATLPPPEPEPAPASNRRGAAPKPASGLRKTKTPQITDLVACITFIQGHAPDHPDLVAVVTKIARKIHDAGVVVPGFEVVESLKV
jgi:hypothetical protein